MRLVKLKPHAKGFSLVEVMIAIGIVAVLLTTFLAVFTPAQRNIQRTLGIKDANRMASALENELAVLRSEKEVSEYQTAFGKAFDWIIDSDDPNKTVLVYQYTAVPVQSDEDVNPDGTPLRYNTTEKKDGIPGKDYITYTVVRSLRDADSLDYIKEELVPGVVTGGVYAVRMTQLVPKSGVLDLGTVGQIVDPDPSSGGSTIADSEDYPQAVITFQAEFFKLNSNQWGYVLNSGWTFEKLGKAVATRNIAVRR